MKVSTREEMKLIRYEGPLHTFDKTFFQHGEAIVALLIHSGGKTCFLNNDSGSEIPIAPLMQYERLIGGIHRALIENLGYDRQSTRWFACDRVEVYILSMRDKRTVFLVHCYFQKTADTKIAPHVTHSWQKQITTISPRSAWLKKLLERTEEKATA